MSIQAQDSVRVVKEAKYSLGAGHEATLEVGAMGEVIESVCGMDGTVALVMFNTAPLILWVSAANLERVDA